MNASVIGQFNKDTLHLAFAGDIGIFWTLPSDSRSRISLNASMASGLIGESDEGESEGLFNAFVPITNKYPGEIFQGKMSSLSCVSLNYQVIEGKVMYAGTNGFPSAVSAGGSGVINAGGSALDPVEITAVELVPSAPVGAGVSGETVTPVFVRPVNGNISVTPDW